MELLWKGSNDEVGARQTRHTCKRAAMEDSKDRVINVLTDVVNTEKTHHVLSETAAGTTGY